MGLLPKQQTHYIAFCENGKTELIQFEIKIVIVIKVAGDLAVADAVPALGFLR